MDIMITELGSGGEIQNRNNDIVTVDGYENQPYLAAFGGGEWWGNGLLVQGDAQFTSKTEAVLKSTPLTSAGLIEIENAMLDDLKYLEQVTGTAVEVSGKIVSRERLDVAVTINGQVFYMSWRPDSSFLTYSLIE